MTTRLSLLRCFGACALAATGAVAMAQQQPGTSADELLLLSTDALRQIDQDQGTALWNALPLLVKGKLSQAEFVSGMRVSRATIGTVTQRNWAGVVRIRYLDDSLGPPAGLYANVDFATQTSGGKSVYEKVTFRLEPDGWRFVGYAPRDTQ